MVMARDSFLRGIWLGLSETDSDLWNEYTPLIRVRIPSAELAEMTGKPRQFIWSKHAYTSVRAGFLPDPIKEDFDGRMAQHIRNFTWQPFQRVVQMLLEVVGGDAEVVRIKAESMELPELLAWLNDPRSHLNHWWRVSGNFPHIRLPNQSALSQTGSPSLKRKREMEEEGKTCGTKRVESDDGSSREPSPSEIKNREIKGDGTERVIDQSGGSDRLSSNDSTPSADTEIDSIMSSASTTVSNDTSISSRHPIYNKEFVHSLPWPQPDPNFSFQQRLAPDSRTPIIYFPADTSAIRSFAADVVYQIWRDVTASLRQCRCRICSRARVIEMEHAREQEILRKQIVFALSQQGKTAAAAAAAVAANTNIMGSGLEEEWVNGYVIRQASSEADSNLTDEESEYEDGNADDETEDDSNYEINANDDNDDDVSLEDHDDEPAEEGLLWDRVQGW